MGESQLCVFFGFFFSKSPDYSIYSEPGVERRAAFLAPLPCLFLVESCVHLRGVPGLQCKQTRQAGQWRADEASATCWQRKPHEKTARVVLCNDAKPLERWRVLIQAIARTEGRS